MCGKREWIDVFVLRRRYLGNDWVLGGTEEHYIS